MVFFPAGKNAGFLAVIKDKYFFVVKVLSGE